MHLNPLIILFSLKLCKERIEATHISLAQIVSNDQFYQGNTEHLYINGFLFYSLKAVSSRSVIRETHRLTRSSFMFVNHCVQYFIRLKEIKTEKETPILVSTPLGIIVSQQELSVTRHIFYHWLPILVKEFRFSTHSFLHLNLTLYELYFSSGPKDCDRGNFTILDTSLKSILFNCGYQSELNIFTNSSSFLIRLSVSNIVFVLKSSFSVLTKGFISSSALPHTQGTPVLVSVHFIHLCGLLKTYHIQTRKDSYLIVRILSKRIKKFVGYDGPGFFSDKMISGNHFLKSSTFQCVLQLSFELGGILSDNVSFTSVALNFGHNTLVHNVSHFNFPTGEGARIQNLCIMAVHAKAGFQIRTQVIHVWFSGKEFEKPVCKYAGFLVTELFNSQHRESGIVCESYTDQHATKRDFTHTTHQ